MIAGTDNRREDNRRDMGAHGGSGEAAIRRDVLKRPFA
jgi:hypothetical protein